MGAIPYEPWPHLRQFNEITNNPSYSRIVVLKARQLGISWDLAIDALHNGLFVPGSNSLMFSRRQVESIEMKERAKFVWRYLPDFLRLPIGKDNDELLTFPTMESKIQSFPATEGAGRGETANLVIMDEWADMPYAEELYTSVLPTVEYGRLIGVSTAKGMSNLFARIYWDAKKGKNAFLPVFIPYNVLWGRNEEWWTRQAANMPGYLAHQEYPRHEADAFLVAGICMFDVGLLRSMDVTPAPGGPGGDGKEIFRPYVGGHEYTAGIDTALGIAGRDFSSLQIIDVTTGDQAAKVRTQRPLEEFANLAWELLREYHYPLVAIEEQPQGLMVAKVLVDKRYPKHRIYHRNKNLPTWHTNEANRKQILAELEQAIRTKAYTLHSRETVEEFLSFGFNQEKGKFEALTGHDDEVMATALAWHMRVNSNPPMEWKTRSYLRVDALDLLEDVDWSKSEPPNGREIIPCPTCVGNRYLEKELCWMCRGVGRVARRASK